MMLAALLLTAAPLAAQPNPPRVDASIGAGYAKTWDDEGSIGRGLSVGGDVSFRVTPRFGLGLRVERLHNFRDAADGAFIAEGNSTLVGGEARVRFGRGAVQPILHAGYGLLSYSGTTTTGPPRNPPFIDLRTEPIPTIVRSHSGTIGVASGGADVDVFVTPRLSIRPGFTVHVTQAGGESLPWMIWRGGVGVGLHW
jgi:Outer membrane protein beta-barrel domain